MTDGLVISVAFQLKANTLERFLTLIRDNATSSVRNEPGCRRFDVAVSVETPDAVFLYEIYDHEAAFQAHLQTSHFLAFKAAVADLVLSQRVWRHRLVAVNEG